MKSRHAIGAAAVMAALFAGAPAHAQVAICDALSLYANGARTGLCKDLSPTTQNLWVCELTTANPDIHLTFNANTALHITVRTPRGAPTCQGNSTLAGSFPSVQNNPLARAAQQPQIVCSVDVDNYISRLIAVPELAAAHNQNRVQTAILNALAAGKVNQATANSYMATAVNNNC
jgi:hypothetical protein